MATINEILAQKPIVQNITDNLDIADLLSWALVSKKTRVIASEKIMDLNIKKTWKKAENGHLPGWYNLKKKYEDHTLNAYLYRYEGSNRQVAYGCVVGKCGCGFRVKCNIYAGLLNGPATYVEHSDELKTHTHYRMDNKIKEYTIMESYTEPGTFIISVYKYGDEPFILREMRKGLSTKENIIITNWFEKHQNWDTNNCPICWHLDALIKNSEF